MMNSTLLCVIVALMVLASTASADDPKMPESPDTTIASVSAESAVDSTERIIVYYLHSNRRCMTCEKLEAYSGEAVAAAFEAELKDSTLLWCVVNFEDEGNEHYVKDYQLYSQSLVVSKVNGEKEVEWKNLDRIWKLVGDKDEYFEYVRSEVAAFMKPDQEEE